MLNSVKFDRRMRGENGFTNIGIGIVEIISEREGFANL
ncbi:hypothetical protein ASZ90_004478 [hydrocarbon metagenome]|uniref:Uncharacterized protein n=1 Tax=hydrocarbon metagenome TaxID=938273 RepID=A0A0W8FY05_9ZZZZ